MAFVSFLKEMSMHFPDNMRAFDPFCDLVFRCTNPYRAGRRMCKGFTWPPGGPWTTPTSAFTESLSCRHTATLPKMKNLHSSEIVEPWSNLATRNLTISVGRSSELRKKKTNNCSTFRAPRTHFSLLTITPTLTLTLTPAEKLKHFHDVLASVCHFQSRE